MLISKFAIMKYSNNSKINKYYQSKGYWVGEKFGDIYCIKIEDLSPNSNAKVIVSCDFCKTIFTKQYCKYILTKTSSTCCKNCVEHKIKISNMQKYGVENVSQLESSKIKSKNTCLDKYGFVSNLCTEETKNSIRKTNLERYGFEYSAQSEKGKKDRKITNLLKYGFDNPMKNEEVKQKVRNSLFENGTCISSKAQRYVCKLLCGVLNYPFKYYNVDMFFPELNIYLEYDGSGHKLQVDRGEISESEYKKRENARFHYLERQGLKLIRWINKSDSLPSDIMILEIFNQCVMKLQKNEISFIVVDLDNL